MENLQKILSERFGIKELKTIEGVKFQCLKTCSHRCCTMSSLLIKPSEIFKMVKAGYGKYILLSIPPFTPLIGKDSLLPLIYKDEMAYCPFLLPEIKEELTKENLLNSVFLCALHDKGLKPTPCADYPAGRITEKNPETGEIKVNFIMSNFVCPPEAFQSGDLLENQVRKDKELIEDKLIEEAKKFKDRIRKLSVLHTALLSIHFILYCEEIKDKAESLQPKHIGEFYEKHLPLIEKIDPLSLVARLTMVLASTTATPEILLINEKGSFAQVFGQMISAITGEKSVDNGLAKIKEIFGNGSGLNLTQAAITAKLFLSETGKIPPLLESALSQIETKVKKEKGGKNEH